MEDRWSPGYAASLSKESATGKAVFPGVIGSPPRFDPIAARPGDYAEVFGDLDGSYSIPFLDLPPALDGLDVATLPSRGSGFDYCEVFGGRDPGGCAASYEEIFLVVPRGEYARSSKGRSTEESTSSHQARKESKHSPAHPSGSHMEWEEGHHLSPNSTFAYNVSTQINVSYSKSSRGIKEGAVSGETHITKLHAFPAFSYVVDSDTTNGNGHLHNIVNDELGNENEKNKLEATFSNTSKNLLRADQKHPTAKSPASGNDHANTGDNSCCSGISTTSGLVSSCDAIFMNASDFSLLKQPMQVSPPSKSPPKFVDKKGHPKSRILSSPKVCMDEIDDSSAAAAASAAVIEAIEFAQAKLKIAKELMEKKQDGPPKSKKLGHHKSLKHNEQKLGQARVVQESFGEMLVALEKRNGITSAANNAEDNARALNKEEEQAKKVKDLELCALPKKSVSKCVFPKMNDKYHELVNSGKYKTEEVSQTEDLIEKTKIMRKSFVVKQNEIVNDSFSSEIERNRKLRKGYMTPVACVHYETDFLEAQGCDVKEVVLEAQGVLKAPSAGEKTPFAGSEKNIEPSNHYTFHYSHDDKEENITVGLAVETSEEKSSYNFVQIDDENQKQKSEMAKPAELVKQINKGNIGSASNGEENLNEVSETAAQLGIQVPRELCISYQQASCMHIFSKKTNRAENQNDTENEMEETLIMPKEGKREEIHMKGQPCSTIENELRLEIDQEVDVLEKDLKKWNSTVETHEESNTTAKATNAACWPDCNVDKASEILVELQQKYQKEDSTPEPSSVVDLEGNNRNNRSVQVSGNEGTIEIQVDHYFMDKIVCLNAIPGIYKGPLDMSLGFQSISLSDIGGELSYLGLQMEDQPMNSQKNILDINKINQNKIEFMKDREQMEKPITKKEENERLFEESNEKKRKLVEEKRERLSEQAKYMEKEIEEGKEKEWLLEEETKKERKLKEQKEQVRLLEAAKEMKVELVEEEQARLIEVREKQKEGAEEQVRSSQTKERERMLEKMDNAILFKEAKEIECKVEEESEGFIEEKVSKREWQKVNGSARTSEENDLKKGEDTFPLEGETHEVQRKASAEARESTVRNYTHAIISEAPGKLFVEAQEKAEKSSYEYLEKLTDKASVKAILIPEDTAVELTTSQVHEYAAERVSAETVASNYDEKHNTTFRDSAKKEIVNEDNLLSRDEHSNLDDQGDAQSLGPGSFNNSQAFSEPDDQQNKNFGKSEPALKCQVTIEKNQRIAERATKALAEMSMREDLAQREQAERNRLGEFLDADIRRWSNGKEGNLRALLSTLQYILGPDSGWQPVSLMDIITASAVKRVYRKATLCVHPDKLQQRGATVQQKYICEKVFDLLNDAWNKFNLEDR